MSEEQISKCCGETVKVEYGQDSMFPRATSMWHVCKKCGNPCDLKPMSAQGGEGER